MTTIGNAINGNKVLEADKQAINEYSKAMSENTGLTGFQKASDEAQKEAGRFSSDVGNLASSNAMEAARQNGTSKAQASLNGANTAAANTANAYVSRYNSSYATIANRQTQNMTMTLKKCAQASQIARDQYAVAQTRLSNAAADLSGAIDFYNNICRLFKIIYVI